MKIMKFSIVFLMLGIYQACLATGASSSDSERISFPEKSDAFLMKKVLLKKNTKNVIYSPFSANTILALLAKASDQFSDVYNELMSLLPDNFAHRHVLDFKTFVKNLKIDPRKQIAMETKIFSRNTGSINKAYINYIKLFYDTNIENLNTKSAEDINNWAKSVTKGNLKKLITDDAVLNANLIMINILYFKGNWLKPFTETFKGPFYVSDKDRIEVIYMSQKSEFICYYNNDMDILQLPYEGNKYNMMILLPKANNSLENLIAKINERQIREWQNQTKLENIKVILPKFQFSSEVNLKDILTSNGKANIFNEASYFKKLGNGVRLSEIKQQAGIAVDERGTTAYAATSAFENKVMESEIFVQRPFLFLILQNGTSNVLFAGKVINPNLSE